MKLPNATHGPVTLSKIDYAANLSQETYAFTATVEINGLSCPVRNDGHGGPNLIQGHEVNTAIEAYCKTLPPDDGLTVTADYLISVLVSNALQAREDAKAKRKGFTHRITGSGLRMYCTHLPGPDALEKAKIDPVTAKIVVL